MRCKVISKVHSKTYRVLTIFLLLLISFSFIPLPVPVPTSTTSKAWWNSSWQYYRVMNINNNGYSGYYQMQINVTYSGSDNISASPPVISCNGHCNQNFSDIRFVQSDNSTVLPYWIEKKVDGSYALVWVNVSSQAISDGKILMYYGNPNANSVSSGDDTFLFFDDFLGSSLSSDWWEKSSNGAYSVSNSVLTVTGGSSLWEEICCHQQFSYNHAFGLRVKADEDGDRWIVVIDDRSDTGSYAGSGIDEIGFGYTFSDGRFYRTEKEGTYNWLSRSTDYSVYRIIEWTWTSTTVKWYENHSYVTQTTDYIPTDNLGFFFGAKNSQNIYVDWVFVRKYTSSEPYWSSFSSEQTQGGGWVNSPPSFNNENPTNGSIDVSLQPTLSVQVTDTDGNSTDIWLWTSEDGGNTWVLRNHTIFSTGNGVVTYDYVEANETDKTYYWKVSANDTHDNVTAIYHFTTKGVKYVYTEDFEDDTVGSDPTSTWYTVYDPSNAGSVSTEQMHSGNNSLKYDGSVSSDVIFYSFNVTWNAYDWFKIYVYEIPATAGNKFSINFENGSFNNASNLVANLLWSEGSLKCWNGSSKTVDAWDGHTYTGETWVYVNFTFNWTTHKYRIDYNGTYIDWFPLPDNATGFDVIYLKTPKSNNGVAYIDDITLASPEELPNNPPSISNPNPANGATDVPITLSQLSVNISDADNDTMTWSIETSPNIGNNSGSTTDGAETTITCSISGLQYNTTYTWYVNVTDGTDWSNTTYTFTTEGNPNYKTFVLLADTHWGNTEGDGSGDDIALASDWIKWKNPDFIFHLGDIGEGESYNYEHTVEWQQERALENFTDWTNNTDAERVFFTYGGGHDGYMQHTQQEWSGMWLLRQYKWPWPYYTIKEGNNVFIFLSWYTIPSGWSSEWGGTNSIPQCYIDWLEEQLAYWNNTQNNIFVITHAMIVNTTAYSAPGDWAGMDDASWMNNSEQLINLFEKYRVDVCMFGHLHIDPDEGGGGSGCHKGNIVIRGYDPDLPNTTFIHVTDIAYEHGALPSKSDYPSLCWFKLEDGKDYFDIYYVNLATNSTASVTVNDSLTPQPSPIRISLSYPINITGTDNNPDEFLPAWHPYRFADEGDKQWFYDGKGYMTTEDTWFTTVLYIENKTVYGVDIEWEETPQGSGSTVTYTIEGASNDMETWNSVSTPVSGYKYLLVNVSIDVNSTVYITDVSANTTEPTNPPVVSNPSPSDGQTNVDITLSQLSVDISDPDGDTMTWSIETSPNIGNNSGSTTDGAETTITCSISGLQYNTTYMWYVNVTDGDSWTNETYSFTTRPQYTPDPPGSFTATTYNTTRIDLSWTKGSGADYTYIERNTIANWNRGEGILIYNDTGTSYSDTGLTPGTTYYYQAWSYNATDNTYSSVKWTGLDFDGANDNVRIPDDDTLNLTSSFTIDMALWIEDVPADNKFDAIISKMTDANTGWGVALYSEDGTTWELHICVDGHNQSVGVASIPTNKWIYPTIVFNNSTHTMHVYINGNEIYSYNEPNTPSANTADVVIGECSYVGNDKTFDGKIDYIRVYNKALTERDVKYNFYWKDSDCITDGLVSWWKFNENTGTTAYDSYGSNDGTLEDGVQWVSGTKEVFSSAYNTTNTAPSLTNPSASPSSGVADYTTFYFNITYSDADGDPPVEIKVNISKTGWYINVTMTYISGDYVTGALYSYSTTLSVGVYDYLFYASDGIASTVNDPTDQVSVEAQSYSFTVSTADPSGQENFTASATMGAEWNVSASYQTSSIPAIQITNTGNVPINISINLTSTPISNVHIKYNTSSTPPSFTQNPYYCDKELTTTPVTVLTIEVGGTGDIWLWADFENKTNPGSYTTKLYITSSFGG